MKVLVTGANGFLGQHLCMHLANHGFIVLATGRGVRKLLPNVVVQYQPIELTSKADVVATITTLKPNVIVHTAAMSKPDECDVNRSACLLNNVEATKHVLEAASLIGASVIYTSTDFVFGEGGPHSEEDEPAPLNFYGQSKLLAEELVMKAGSQHAIMRPVFIYGKAWEGMRPTFLHWVKHNLEQGKPIKVVNDQFRTPTHVQDLCKGLEAMIRKQATGIYHLAGREILTPYQMAITVAKVLELNDSLIESVTAETFAEPVKRAKKSGLAIDKAAKELGYQRRSFEEGVKETFNLN
jgi:dTDP-4-dehydrorhamnose reductase